LRGNFFGRFELKKQTKYILILQHDEAIIYVYRFLMRLKGSVRTKSHPKGSIMDGSLFYDSLTLCAHYLHGSTQFYRQVTDNEGLHTENSSTTLFHSIGRGLAGKSTVTLDHKTWLQAHRYVLFNYANIEPYLE